MQAKQKISIRQTSGKRPRCARFQDLRPPVNDFQDSRPARGQKRKRQLGEAIVMRTSFPHVHARNATQAPNPLAFESFVCNIVNQLRQAKKSSPSHDLQFSKDLQRQPCDFWAAPNLQRQPPRSLASRRQRQHPARANKRLSSAKARALATQSPRFAGSGKGPILGLVAKKRALGANPKMFVKKDFQRQPPDSSASKL